MTTLTKNWNCDGDKCTDPKGEVRLYPTGGGGNMIYCRACFSHENNYRRQRGSETGQPDNWPVVSWRDATVYAEATPAEPVIIRPHGADVKTDVAEVRERLAHIRGESRKATAAIDDLNNKGVELHLRQIEHEIKMIRRQINVPTAPDPEVWGILARRGAGSVCGAATAWATDHGKPMLFKTADEARAQAELFNKKTVSAHVSYVAARYS